MRDRVGLNSTYLSLLTSLRTQADSRDAQDALRGRADPWQARAGHDRQAADAPGSDGGAGGGDGGRGGFLSRCARSLSDWSSGCLPRTRMRNGTMPQATVAH